MVFSLEDCGFRRRSQVRWIPEAQVKPASQSVRTWMEMPSRITSPAYYLCVSPARTNEYIWALCALSNVVNDIVHACDRLLRWYSVPIFLAPTASVLVGILAKGLFLLRSFECEAAAEPGPFDAIAEVEVYACYCLCSNFHQFAVEHETEAAHGDLARSLGYHVVCVSLVCQ